MNNANLDKCKEDIDSLGFTVIKNFFSAQEINDFEVCTNELFLLQAQKIGEYREKAIEIQASNLTNFQKITAVYEMMETNDKEALYQVQKYLSSSQIARRLYNENFIKLAAALLGSDEKRLLIDGPAVFVNRPNTERLLYKWHSEAHYYPKRRRFLNIWLPVYDAKSKSNGTMAFKVGSHKKDFPFSDYQGYNKDSQNKSNYFIQYEIPSSLLDGYKEYYCEVSPTDLVIFHKGLVHTSNPNTSNKYSLAVVSRVWDPSDDLTLSGSIGATPYGGNVGRANLWVSSLE